VNNLKGGLEVRISLQPFQKKASNLLSHFFKSFPY